MELRIDSIASLLIESYQGVIVIVITPWSYYLWTACSPGLAGLVESVGWVSKAKHIISLTQKDYLLHKLTLTFI